MQLCPICERETNFKFVINEEGKKSNWYYCPCGVVSAEKDESFNKPYEVKKEHIDFYRNLKFCKEVMTYAPRLYLPLIEEMTYGRHFLDVGFALPYVMDYASERGWITWGIDINPDAEGGKHQVICADFTQYDFGEQKFDCIWMNHIFEHFKDPVAMLAKIRNLLNPDGCCFIATPDTDFIFITSPAQWGHWKKGEHFILWSLRALKKSCRTFGFDIILSRKNYSKRFIAWNDCHLIIQRPFKVIKEE